MPYKAHDFLFDPDYKGRYRWFLPSNEITHGELTFKNPMTEEEREHAVGLYDSEILYFDRELKRLLECIKNKDDNNIIIFTSDHGEGMGEHNYYYAHGDILNQPALRVPLLIRGIDFPRKKVSKTVRLMKELETLALGKKEERKIAGCILKVSRKQEVDIVKRCMKSGCGRLRGFRGV